MIGKMLLALVLIVPAPIAAQGPAALPGWMTGAWIDTKGGQWAEEYWTPPRGGLMMGAGRNGKGGELLGWEATRIAIDRDGRMTFTASPGGGASTVFTLETSGSTEISFINPTHNYPQRIRYWRDGDALAAEISLMDGSKPMRWRYRPMGN